MAVILQDIVKFLNQELKPSLFNDYAPNGLQVEGKKHISKIVTGVTACELLLDEAIKLQADAVLVHHGYFWKGENPCVCGMKKKRLQKLLIHDLSLLAYHLPLDAHPVLGNNVQLAKRLGINITGGLEPENKNSIGNVGELLNPISCNELIDIIKITTNREPMFISGGDKKIKKVALCTGGAQDFIDYAIEQDADAYISGEISERTVHIARESNIHYFAAGHHATERFGVQAVGDWLQNKFDIEHVYVEIDNPV